MLRLLLAVFLAILAVYAQNITGTITGEVRDSTGAVIPGAAVTAASSGTGISYSTRTNATGVYVLTLLPLGNYAVAVEQAGFKKFVRSGLALGADQRLRVDAALSVGAVEEQITVTGEAPAVKTDQSTVGESFTPSQLENLPVGRSVLNMVKMVPGVQSGKRDVSTGNINGSRAQTTDYEIDGLAAVSSNLSDVEVQPIIEMVEEMVVQTAQYSAESGRGATQVSLTTRSGTNEFKGTLFHFLRNNVLNANSFMNNALGSGKPILRHNLFGATVGGPVVLPRLYNGHNRTFFSAAYEGLRERGFAQAVSSVPTGAMRSGDFTGLNPIYDPATTRAGAGSGYIRSPFPSNLVPVGRISAPAKNMLDAAYPLPTRAGLVNNYIREGATIRTSNAVNARGDHNFSESSRLSLRYLYRKVESTGLMRFPGPAGAGSNSVNEVSANTFHAGSLDHTYLFSPTLIHNVRFGVYRLKQQLDGPGTFQDWPTRMGLKNIPGDKFPEVTIAGLAPFGGSNIFDGFPARNWNLNDSLTWVRGRHSVKFGGEYRHLIFVDSRGTASTFNFDARPSMDPQTSRYGEPFSSYLLGIPSSSNLNIVNKGGYDFRTHYIGGFIHDDFKFSRRLTLNLGLRWEMTTPRIEVSNFQSVFDLASRTLKIAGRDGYPRTLHDTDWVNFQPRIGFAFLPFNDEKTVLRGGYGVFVVAAEVMGNSFTQGPWQKTESWQTPDNGITYPMTLETAFPPVALDVNAPVRLTTGTGVNWMQRDQPNAYMQQWSLNVQRQAPLGLVVETGYLGTRGLHLPVNYNLNQVPVALLGPGNAQSRRPYPEVNAVTTVRNGMLGASTYHAFQLRVQRRMTGGLAVMASYTMSKTLDNCSGLYDWQDYGFTGVQNHYDLRAERSVAGFDIAHNLAYSFIWQLPVGKGRRFGNRSGWFDAALGGWNVSTLSTVRSGMPLVLGTQGNLTGSLGGGSRSNRTRDVALSGEERGLQRWFDASGFSLPDAYTFGNTSRTEPRLRGPGDMDLDIMLAKDFRLSEKRQLQLRSEFFNALNHFNPGMPNTSIGNRAVGQITSGNAGRTVQLSLRLYY